MRAESRLKRTKKKIFSSPFHFMYSAYYVDNSHMKQIDTMQKHEAAMCLK